MKYFDAKILSNEIRSDVSNDVKKFGYIGLAVILVGDNEMSKVYVAKKEQACLDVGIHMSKFLFKENVSEDVILSLLKNLNNDLNVNGILIQLPLPTHLNAQKLVDSVSPLKDVDGMHSINLGGLAAGQEQICPCTPKGVISLLDYHKIRIMGQRVAIIGRSRLVGRPMSFMLINRNATITLCHTKTMELNNILMNSDIIISATGVPNIISKCKDNAIVINIGMTKVEGKIKGDVDLQSVQNASLVTPILGCTGLMTITSLLKNVVECYKLQNGVKI